MRGAGGAGPAKEKGDTRSPHTGSNSTRRAVDLGERRGVAEPGEEQAFGGVGGGVGHERDLPGGLAAVAVVAEEQLAQDAARGRGRRGRARG